MRRSGALGILAGIVMVIGFIAAILWVLAGKGALCLIRFDREDAGNKTAYFIAESKITLPDGRTIPIRIHSPFDGKTGELGRILTPFIAQFDPDSSLSPESFPPPHCPVYLLHGADDNVVPVSETRSLAAFLHADTEVHVLVSELIQHVEFKKRKIVPPLLSIWRMARFRTALLRE